MDSTLTAVCLQVFIKETVPPEVQAAARYQSSQFWHQQSAQQPGPQGNLFMRACRATGRCVGNQPSIRTMVQACSFAFFCFSVLRCVAGRACAIVGSEHHLLTAE